MDRLSELRNELRKTTIQSERKNILRQIKRELNRGTQKRIYESEVRENEVRKKRREAVDKHNRVVVGIVNEFAKENFPGRTGKGCGSFRCQECGKKYRTVASIQNAMRNGCTKCGGSDIDVDY